jgi:CheY-like chemotaxis protein
MSYENLKALIVDDDETVRFLVRNVLDSFSIKSMGVSTGTEAIEKLSSEKFDFILMDIRMPDQDGIDAVKWIRDLDKHQYRDLPIFALTSFSTQAHKQEILDAGFNEHLVKPLQEEKLILLLEKYFWKPQLS